MTTDEVRPAEFIERHRDYIENCKFLFIASASPSQGADVSPRGDLRQLVKIHNGRNLLIPDRIGNNRLDTLRNIVECPLVSLHLLESLGLDVLTLTGIAQIRTDSSFLEQFEFNGKLPKSVLLVEIKGGEKSKLGALARSAFWKTGFGDSIGIAPLGDILADQLGGLDKDEVNEFVATSYRERVY